MLAEIQFPFLAMASLAGAYGAYRLYVFTTFSIIIWKKRDDAEHVKQVAEAHARLAEALRPPRLPSRRRRRRGRGRGGA